MKIVETRIEVPVTCMRTGKVFRYKGKLYLVTNAYFGQYMDQDKRAYIDLETGQWKSFTGEEEVEPIKDIRLVVGPGKEPEDE